MNTDIGQGLAAIGGAIIAVAIVSVIVGRNSTAPKLISATGASFAKIIAAAVNPVGNAANNGNLGTNTFTTPAIGALGDAGSIGSSIGSAALASVFGG